MQELTRPGEVCLHSPRCLRSHKPEDLHPTRFLNSTFDFCIPSTNMTVTFSAADVIREVISALVHTLAVSRVREDSVGPERHKTQLGDGTEY